MTKYGDGKWIQDAYDREVGRFKSIIDMIDSSPNNMTTINGYKCKKDKNGEYFIGYSDRYYDSLVTISPNQEYKGDHELRSTISMGKVSGLPIGQICVSNIKERNAVETIACNSLSQQYANNTILENAINFHYSNPQTDKKRQVSVQQVLTMLNDLGIELTPTENLEMLKGKKQFLEDQLVQVNKELAQKESEQK